MPGRTERRYSTWAAVIFITRASSPSKTIGVLRGMISPTIGFRRFAERILLQKETCWQPRSVCLKSFRTQSSLPWEACCTAMSVSSLKAATVFSEHYRCEEKYGQFESAEGLSADCGYFRFSQNAICYGRTAAGSLQLNEAGEMYDVLQDVRVQGGNTVLPFDPKEVVDNLRYERYRQSSGKQSRQQITGSSVAKSVYYMIRPFLPVQVRKHLQRIYLKDWNRITFPSWPVDRTVDNIFEQLMALSVQSHGVEKIPFIWFWPDGYTGCVMMTHDVETQAGREFF